MTIPCTSNGDFFVNKEIRDAKTAVVSEVETSLAADTFDATATYKHLPIASPSRRIPRRRKRQTIRKEKRPSRTLRELLQRRKPL